MMYSSLFHIYYQGKDCNHFLIPVLSDHYLFVSNIACFNVFSYSKVITFIQSRNFVYRILAFEISSLVFETDIDVITAQLLAI